METNLNHTNNKVERENSYYTNLKIQHDITVKISSMSDLEQAMQFVIESICQIQEIDCGGIYLIDPGTSCINLAAHYNLSDEFVSSSSFYEPDSHHAKLVNEGKPVYLKYPDLVKRKNPLYFKEGFRSTIILPIHYNGKAIAAFNLASRKFDKFTSETLMAIESIALAIGGSVARIRTEKTLRESQQNFINFFDTIEDFLFILNEKGIILKSNVFAQRKLGYTEEELNGLSVLEIHPKERRKEANDLIHAMIAGIIDFCPIPLLTKTGKQIPVETKVTLGVWDGTTALFGVCRDISWRQKIENDLIESEEKYRTITDSTIDIIFIMDNMGNLLFVNERITSVLGYKPSEMIGKSFKNFVPLTEITKLMNHLIYGFTHHEIRNLVTQIYHKKGHLIDVEINGRTFQYEGNLAGLGTIRDISERINAGKALKKSETKYRNLIDTMQDGVYRSTPEGRFVEINPALVKILGYNSKSELLAVDIKKDLYFDLSDRESAILEEEHEEQAIYPLRKKDGSKIWVEDHGWLVTDDNGKVIYHEGVLRDVTERELAAKKLEKYSQELAEINETKDKFFNIIAHDLKSPFNTILGFSELLVDDYNQMEEEQIKKYLLSIQKSSQHACNLIDNLLLWARTQSGTIDFYPDTIDLNDIVNQNLSLFENVAKTKNITMISKNKQSCFIYADRNMIDTVVRNLVANAIKFTPLNGNIMVEVNETQASVEISVSDTGVGIPEQHIPDLFRMESKYTTLGTAKEKGTGMGLMLCKEFVEKHGGNIWVESQMGKGSVFTFTIPKREI